MPSAKPEKAVINNLDDKNEDPIECLFNPTDYAFHKRINWARTEIKGGNVPEIEFSGGDSMTLKMTLFFDTYAIGGDVREITNRIWKLTRVNEKLTDMTSVKGRPPLVEFRWGKTWSFQAVITDIAQKFTLFRYDGTPVRATLDVEFTQAKEEGKYPGQNPTTVSIPGYRQRVVKEGETIDWIAFEEYGDAGRWRYIAAINNLDDPLAISPGQRLAIAPLP